MKIKIKKKLTVLLTLATTISFAACGTAAEDSSTENLQESISSYTSLVSDSSNQNDDSIQPSENSVEEISSVTSDNVTNEKKVSLVELESNGEIGFDNIYKFNGLGNYAYIDGLEKRDYWLNWLNIDDNEGLIPFIYNKNIGYINENGEVKIKNIYKDVAPFSEGKAFVQDTIQDHVTKLLVIDTEGETLFTYNTEENWSIVNPTNIVYKNNRAAFLEKNSKYRLVILDENFNVSKIDTPFSVSFDSDNIYSVINTPYFLGVLAYTTDSYINEQASIMNEQGDIIWEGKTFDVHSSITEACGNAGNKGALGKQYLITISEKYANVMNKDKKWGLMDVTTGKMVIDYSYDCMGAYGDGVIPVCSYGKWGLIDINGNQLAKNEYKYINTYSNGVAFAVDQNNHYCLIDKNGNVKYDVNAPIYDKHIYQITKFNKSGIAYITDGYYSYIISNTGECLIPGNEVGIKLDFGIYASEKYVIAVDEKGRAILYKITN